MFCKMSDLLGPRHLDENVSASEAGCSPTLARQTKDVFPQAKGLRPALKPITNHAVTMSQVLSRRIAPVLIALFLPQALFAASFDCFAAKHVSDKEICYDDELSQKEEAYVDSYQESITQGGGIAAEAKRIAARQMIDRRNCEGKPDCIRKVLEAAHAALEQNNAPYWSNDGPQDGPYFGPKNWTQLDTVSSYKLISLWWRLDHSCRGGSTIMHIDDCATREEISEYLTTIRGMCYGRHGEVRCLSK